MASASPLLPGDPPRLGAYWLAGRIGAGGQGVVYEAYDEQGRRVALKVLHGDAAADPDLRVRFGKEATAARRVASFCTARVLDVDLDGPKPYIASEYVEGPSLRKAVRDGRRFAGDELHRLAVGVATALAAIHDAGVIHRDLKPDNVLLGPDGPRVIDFGIARTLEMSLTATGQVVGTPTYMAPEVFSGQRAGAPADVFSWGAIVLYAAVGDDPFRAENLGAVMHRVLSADPDLSALPASLRPLVGMALSKDPLTRPSARDLLTGLITGFDGPAVELLAAGSAEAGRLRTSPADPALGTLAEDAYGLLDQQQRAMVPDVFLRMMTVGDEGEVALRSLPADELFAGRTEREQEALRRILEVFRYMVHWRDGERGRELVLGRPALLHAWPRLRAWVLDEQEGLPVHTGIRSAARHWDAQGRRESDVFQGTRLENALRWAATGRRHLTLNPLERDFLDACNAATRHRVRRRRTITIVLAVLLVIALAAGGVTVYQSGQLARQRDVALAENLVAEADTLRPADPVRAALLNVAAWRLDPEGAAFGGLIDAWAARESRVFADPQTSGETRRLLSKDGRRFISVSTTGVRVYDARTGRRVGGWDGLSLDGARLLDAVISPSGRYLAVAGGGRLRLWDLRTGHFTGRERPLPAEELFHGLRYAGEWYVLSSEGQSGIVWDTRTGQQVASLPATLDAAASPDGDLLATVDTSGRFALYRLPGGAEVERSHLPSACEQDARSAAFNADAGLVCLNASQVSIVDVRTGRTVSGPYFAKGDDVQGGQMWLSPDGRLLAAGHVSHLSVIRVSDGKTLLDYEVAAEEAAFDGRTLRVLSDGNVIDLDLTDLLAPTSLPADDPARISPDGRLLLINRETGTQDKDDVRLWDFATRRPVGGPLRLSKEAGVPMASFGRRLLAIADGLAGVATSVRVWDVTTLKRVKDIPMPEGRVVVSVALSPDDTTLAVGTAAPDGPLGATGEDMRVWDMRTRRWLTTIPVGRQVDAVINPATRTLALLDTVSNRLRRLDDGKETGPALGSGGLRNPIAQIAFSPNGRVAVIGDAVGRVAFWDVVEGRRLGPMHRVHGIGGFDSAAFSPKGDRAVTIYDQTVQLWDMSGDIPRQLGRTIVGGDNYTSAAFTSDGSALRLTQEGGVLHSIPVSPDRLVGDLCARAGRSLTEAEWERDLPGVPYEEVCPGQ
ncbi:WD40 repeat domain-containing serine/threonine protein kinase [Thermopolyspora sp. NPDC052614]|uniref:serine/threonine-protein kinase n=1 Tax=Thermopolyspora sp. NPDC052614 TaxID=3155682 RepID=UPI0034407992